MQSETEELFVVKVDAGRRTYFFDVKETRENVKYLKISESKRTSDGFEHYRVMVFEEDLESFSEGLKKALSFLGQGVKDKADVIVEEKAYSVKNIRKEYPRAYETWEPTEDELLTEKFFDGLSVTEIAAFLERKPGAISSRLRKIGLTK